MTMLPWNRLSALLAVWTFLPPPAPGAPLAFPGAEGFGKNAAGGRGGEVYHVTNLRSEGPGSFAEGVSRPGRTLVFDTSGIIQVAGRLVIPSRTTIAGQTAPGDGITLFGGEISYSGSQHCITRFIRIRMGIAAGEGRDAVGIASGNDLIFDHISVSWGRDENFSTNGPVRDLTLQNSIVAQGLQPHSCGGLITTQGGGVSILRNLYIDNHTRNVKAKGRNQYVNNVVYNWGAGAYIMDDSGDESWADVLDNYFVQGPNPGSQPITRGTARFQIHGRGNHYDDDRDGVLDGRLLGDAEYAQGRLTATPFDFPALTKVLTAREALDSVASRAGASLRRDTVDKRLIRELLSGGTLGQTVRREDEPPMVGPGLVKPGIKPRDTDGDGMPDTWESAHALDPANPADGNHTRLSTEGFTNLEMYLNELAGDPVRFVSTTSTLSRRHAPYGTVGRDPRTYVLPSAGMAVVEAVGPGKGIVSILYRGWMDAGENRLPIPRENLPRSPYLVRIRMETR